MRKLHVLFRKEDLDVARLDDKIVVVLDVLFATTSILTVLEHGAAEVIPAVDEHEARDIAQNLLDDSYLLAGENAFRFIDGFAMPTPIAMSEETVERRRVIYCTTNGTVALRRAENANRVLVGALLNGNAVAEQLNRDNGNETVLIVCAGTKGAFNLEDFYGAGQIVDGLTRDRKNSWDLTDAAISAAGYFRRSNAEECLSSSAVGRLMKQMGLEHEVQYAAQEDRMNLVPTLEHGRIVSPT
jgi:2-phosphosulfolactate phosphatase